MTEAEDKAKAEKLAAAKKRVGIMLVFVFSVQGSLTDLSVSYRLHSCRSKRQRKERESRKRIELRELQSQPKKADWQQLFRIRLRCLKT